MPFRVEQTSRAEREVDKIVRYIAKRSPDGAYRWYEALLDAIDLLRTNPEGRALALEGAKFGLPVRQVLFKTRAGNTYRALFIVNEEDKRVTVFSVRGPAQRLLRRNEIRNSLDE